MLLVTRAQQNIDIELEGMQMSYINVNVDNPVVIDMFAFANTFIWSIGVGGGRHIVDQMLNYNIKRPLQA